MSDIKSIIDLAVVKHKASKDNLLPMLQEISTKTKCLSSDIIAYLAESIDMSTAHIYGVATFYSFLSTTEEGEFVVRLCKTITCDMAGKARLATALEKHLNIKFGETTPNKKFTLCYTNCLGWCHQGPAMMVNNEVYTNVTPHKAIEIIENYKQEVYHYVS